MTIAEELRAEGINIDLTKDKAERDREIAGKLLFKGASVADIHGLTDLPVDEIEALKKRLYH
jgi:hypothetical protein